MPRQFRLGQAEYLQRLAQRLTGWHDIIGQKMAWRRSVHILARGLTSRRAACKSIAERTRLSRIPTSKSLAAPKSRRDPCLLKVLDCLKYIDNDPNQSRGSPRLMNRYVFLTAFVAVVAIALGEGRTAASDPQASQNLKAAHADIRLGEMVTIPAGRFIMGNNNGSPEERPEHEVYLPTYQIGKYEVTRGDYRKFIEAGGYDDPKYWSLEGWKWKESDGIDYAGMYGAVTHTVRPKATGKRGEPEHWAAEQEWIGHGYGHPRFIQTDKHPVVGVTYYEAEAYCKWAGGRLPTEAEYEKAARWDEKKQHSNIWPWGDTWDAEKSNNPDDHNVAGGGCRVNQSAPVGSYPAGASSYGCMDMAGNAYEWCADWAKSYPGNPQPFDYTNKYQMVKGGCWDDPRVTCAFRTWYLPPSSSGTGPGDSDYIGFRIAR